MFRGPLSKWGPTLVSANTRVQKRKRTICSFPRPGLLRMTRAGEEQGSQSRMFSAAPASSGPIRDGVEAFWVGALLPGAMCSRPGLAAFLQAQLSPPPMLPGICLPLLWGKSAPRRFTGPSQAPWVSGEMADQMVGNGGQPKAETKITQREKKEESMKQKQQGKFLHLTPTGAYLHSPRKNSVIQSPVPNDCLECMWRPTVTRELQTEP